MKKKVVQPELNYDPQDFTETVLNPDFRQRISWLQEAGVKIYWLRSVQDGWEIKYWSQGRKVWSRQPKVVASQCLEAGL